MVLLFAWPEVASSIGNIVARLHDPVLSMLTAAVLTAASVVSVPAFIVIPDPAAPLLMPMDPFLV
jgi:hypothetical protein